MKTINVNSNITVTASDSVIRNFLYERERYEAERAVPEDTADFERAMEQARLDGDFDLYSDMFKDLYGFRPR